MEKPEAVATGKYLQSEELWKEELLVENRDWWRHNI